MKEQTSLLLMAVFIVGVVGCIGLILILLLAEETANAVICAGLLGTFITTIVGFMVTVSGLAKISTTQVGQGDEQTKLVHQTNSRMDQLIEQTRLLATHTAIIAERKRVAEESAHHATDSTAGEQKNGS